MSAAKELCESLMGNATRTEEQDRLENRLKIVEMEKILRTVEPVEMPVTHRFARGPGGIYVYAREMFAPKGTIAIGKIHKFENISIISKGEFSVYTEAGEVLHVVAPHTWVAPPGTQRACYFHEDTIWTNVHVATTTDLSELEAILIAKGFDDPGLLEQIELLKLEGK